MRHTAITVIAFAVLATLTHAQDITLDNSAPVVIKTVPEAGTSGVDPALTSIQVTFSKRMRDGSWSWVVASKSSFPKMEGQPKFLADNRTCALPVKLEPGKTYAVWLNSTNHQDFKDTGGRPAVPYLLVFSTR
jgi:hypothetical protein